MKPILSNRHSASASRWCLSLGLAASITLPVGAEPIQQDASLSFSTQNQSLFYTDGETVRTESLRFAVVDEKDTLLEKGQIKNSQVPLSVSTLQAIWQRSINTCRAQGYTIPVINKRISPSQSECINGEIRRDYCVVPPQLGWKFCPDIGKNRRTYTKNLGPGIGNKPTKPTKKPYDFGATFKMTSNLQVGFEGFYRYDLGSVDVDYTAEANITVDTDEAAADDIVTITTSFDDRDPYVMSSRYPFFELALDMYAYAVMAVDAEYAGVNESNGDQVRQSKQLHVIDSRENADAIDGFMPFTNGEERLFGIKLDTTGFTKTILGFEQKSDAKYEYNMTFPFNPPDDGKNPAKKAPKFKYPVSFSLADFVLSGPSLDTPAAPGFQCGDCVPYRNDVVNDWLTNTTPVGNRTLIGGITDGNGIVLPFVNDGVQDVDLARIDLDLDVITVAAGVPLGVIVGDPLGVFEVELNLLDMDLATFLSVDQALKFRPNLEVIMTFSVPTEVRRVGDPDFTSVSQFTLSVGESLEFRQPATGVSIVPTYSIRNNEFTNVTQLKASNAIQETLGQIKIGGYVGDNLESVLGDDPNFAMLQITPTLYDPVSVWSSDTTPWSLDGFTEKPQAALVVGLPGSSVGGGGGGSGGGGNNGGGGNGNGSNSGGGDSGGGALDLLALLGMSLAIGASRRRRRPRCT